jgi:hypothetical protein
MKLPKRYGQSRIEKCPFCGKTATVQNKQGFPVCRDHKGAVMNDMKCACGEYLDIKQGKYGVFFLCINCGPVNVRKAFELNEVRDVSEEHEESKGKSEAARLYNQTAKRMNEKESRKQSKPPIQKRQDKKEITITSDDVYYFS